MQRKKAFSAAGSFVFAIISSALLAASAQAAAPNAIEITYQGTISPRCSVIPGDSVVTFASIEAGRTANLAFGVDCNEPYEITITSENGGLMTPASGDLAGFTNLVPYEVNLVVGSGDGPVQSGWCSSKTLKDGAAGSCRTITSNDKVSIDQVASAEWRLVLDKRPLIAGDYTDNITITIGPRGI